MARIELFPKQKIVGVFRGFSEGGLEFHADLILPYKSEFQSIPMHGQFLLVQLETENEAVLGRITSLSSAGKLASGTGEEFNIRALQEGRPVPEDLREKYLKYQVNIRVLGVVRINGRGRPYFLPSHRRLPHVGSPVAFLDDEVLRQIVGHNDPGSPIGHYALGEFVYCGDSKTAEVQEGMQIKSPEVMVKFPIRNLVSQRSFIFARAGFGKSNLNKLLFSTLYEETPTTEKRKGRQVPVGTVLFDPDGEYFWPDDKGRPGLCDVPYLQDKLVIFTNRRGPSEFYHSYVAGGVKLDIRRLRPADVISIAISPEKQDQQNIGKLRGLSPDSWIKLVDLIDEKGNLAAVEDVTKLLHLDKGQEVEALAARSNMTKIVKSLHDRESQLMDMLLHALKEGKLCVIDISQMRGSQSLILSGIILRRIFDHNQDQFTEAVPETIPVLAVIEEAQSVLNERAAGAEPYIEWVKEGRKYDLGAILITQQPGSIPNEILSQGDNWFVFHLLSAGDLQNIRNANAHFSADILSTLLNEPIPGQGVFWSSSSGRPYPVGIRVLSFEKMYELQDHDYNRPRVDTFAGNLRDNHAPLADALTGEVDQLVVLRRHAVNEFRDDLQLMKRIGEESGVAWGELKKRIFDVLPEHMADRDESAYQMVSQVLNELLGEQSIHWESFKNSRQITCVRRVRP
jgi:DNA helicase HerA-like ATPase